MENGSSRVALVTGAARGIGRGIALRLAADGLDVAVDAMAGWVLSGSDAALDVIFRDEL